MAGSVSVESMAVKSGIGVCKTCVHELQTASKTLKRSYQNAGSEGWNDQKYIRLGGIVEECASALEGPIGELQNCQSTLGKLLDAIQEYEENNL
ncbi:MAG: hypothetical protein PHC41_11365 [Lachnospiraceae bacterium]|nr:hypothetical protein [Lachnospiraceae bacterium]MDD3616806.1 hypothetical protein [Lachnospiraceae bacterium]